MFEMFKIILNNIVSPEVSRYDDYHKTEGFKGFKGRLLIKTESCDFCTACSKKCLRNAIMINEHTKTIEIDPYKCILCGQCVDACIKNCIKFDKTYIAPSNSTDKIIFKQTNQKIYEDPGKII